MSDIRVHALSISHKHGVNVYVCESEEAAMQQLYKYVEEWWGDGPGWGREHSTSMPEDHERAIHEYFEYMADEEGYTLTEETVVKEVRIEDIGGQHA